MIEPTDTIGDDVRLYRGDCLAVLPTLAAESVHMIWTDPPYGHGNMDGDLQAARVRDGVKGARVREAEPIANDRSMEYEPLMNAVLPEFARVLDNDCCCCCCAGGGGPSPAFGWLALRMDDSPLSFFHAVVWDKSARGDGMGWRYRRNYEFVLIAYRTGGKLRWNPDVPAMANVFRDCPPRERMHPNEKPVQLVRRMIEAHTLPGDTILDPFMGSGTTGVAVAQAGQGRKFIGIELDPAHYATALRRLTHATGAGPGQLFGAAS